MFGVYLLIAGAIRAAAPELVMQEGMTITATTKAGTIAILAGRKLERTYTWEGASRSATLDPREERWHGSLGAYFPGPGLWREHKGITRGVLEEGQQHFKSEGEAMKWLREQAGYYPTVYRDDGLVVSFDKTLERRQLDVNVWQILVGGEKPRKLPGSANDKIGNRHLCERSNEDRFRHTSRRNFLIAPAAFPHWCH